MHIIHNLAAFQLCLAGGETPIQRRQIVASSPQVLAPLALGASCHHNVLETATMRAGYTLRPFIVVYYVSERIADTRNKALWRILEGNFYMCITF